MKNKDSKFAVRIYLKNTKKIIYLKLIGKKDENDD